MLGPDAKTNAPRKIHPRTSALKPSRDSVSRRCSPTSSIRGRRSCTAPNTRAGKRCPVLPQSSVAAPDGREMLVGRLDLPVLGFPRSPFEPPGQGGRREGKEQEEGNKTSAHCRTGGGFLITFQLAPSFSDVSVTPYLAAERPHQSFSRQN